MMLLVIRKDPEERFPSQRPKRADAHSWLTLPKRRGSHSWKAAAGGRRRGRQRAAAREARAADGHTDHREAPQPEHREVGLQAAPVA
jgi:hypothetical protein